MVEDFVVPGLRKNLKYDIFEEDEQTLILLSDPNGYSPQPLAVPKMFYDMLTFVNGQRTITEIVAAIKAHFSIDLDYDILINLLKTLNDNYYLESPNYFFVKFQDEYYKSLPVRPAICVGSSYPQEVQDCELFIEKILSCSESEEEVNSDFFIVPHIDLNLGELSHKVYAEAYNKLLGKEYDTVVIFGTAHNRNSDLFMLSEKSFQTPLGINSVDEDILMDLKFDLKDSLTIDETAHKNEHSIELQLLLIQYVLKKKDFTIVPILTGSFFEFLMQKQQPNQSMRFSSFLTSLKSSILKRNKKTLFIASADFAHIGRKFQDNFDAEPILKELEYEDFALIDRISKRDSEGFFDEIAKVNDKRKICGLSPIYSMLEYQKLLDDSNFKGKFLKYNQWNEIETRSAVSFASFAFPEV